MKDQRGLGPRALSTIAELWQAKGARSHWRDDGFDWWPGDFKVSVSALRRLDEFGPEMWQISVRTDFLKDVSINEPDFATRVGLLSKLSSTYALIYPPPDVWKQYGVSGVTPGLSFSNTIMQPIHAQLQSATTAPLFPGSSPAVSRPEALAKSGLDAMLEVAAQAYVPDGREPSWWLGKDEFWTIATHWNQFEYCHGEANKRGLFLETSFGDTTARIALWTDQASIQLGNGLLATLQIPFFADAKTIADECAHLNFAETLWIDIPQFGRWHPHTLGEGRECPAFAMFIPNALYGPGIASHAVHWMLQRARGLRQQRWPDAADRPIHEILEARMAGRN
jgi:hypothetical protein